MASLDLLWNDLEPDVMDSSREEKWIDENPPIFSCTPWQNKVLEQVSKDKGDM